MLQRFFIFLTLILVLPDIYIFRMYIARLMIRPALKVLYCVPTLFFLTGIVYIAFLSPSDFVSQHTLGIGWFSIFFFLFALPKLVFMLCSLIGLPFNYLLHWSKTPFTYAGLLLAAVSAGIILYGSFIGRTRFDVKEIVYHSPQLPPAFKGYRIVQLSDIHIGSWKGNTKAIRRMVDLVNAQQPDLIVFTGDLVNNEAKELEEFQQTLSGLHAKDGVYSILGNHDYGPYRKWESQRAQVENLNDLKRRQAEMGWKLLNNEHVVLHQGTDSIALIGVENEGEPPFSQYADLPKAMKGTEGMFQLLLSHNPTHWRREVLPETEINLMLAGHTHAMQMTLGHHSLSSFVYPEWGGMYAENGQSLYVNVGVGYVGLPFRFGAWPEITVITLE